MNPAFWSGKRVFITGHTGFKGSWLCLYLHRLGAEVTGYALEPPSKPSLFSAARVDRHVRSVHGDIRDAKHLNACLQQHHPDVVFHLAAQSLVRLSYAKPVETYDVNVMGSILLFEAVRQQASVRALVNITSDKCYRNRESAQGYREDDELGGHDPYSNSKACAELVTSAWRDSFFRYSNTALASVRAGNVIGGGDWAADRLIPDLVRALSQGQAPVIRNPSSIRPWQHVLEPLSGYLLLAEKLFSQPDHFAEAWNFGPDEADARPVRWIADRITQLWGSDAPPWQSDLAQQQPHGTTCLRLDNRKAREKLEWIPRWSLDTALQHSVDWYRAFYRHDDMFTRSCEQIDAYLSS